jgi:hypothetical protein
MASVGSTTVGSGRSSKRTSRVPEMIVPRMDVSPVGLVLIADAARVLPGWSGSVR